MASPPRLPPPPAFDFSPSEKLSQFFYQEVMGCLLSFLASLREFHAKPDLQSNIQARLWAAAKLRETIAFKNYQPIHPYLYASVNKVEDVMESISRLHNDVLATYEAVEHHPAQLSQNTPPAPPLVDVTPVVTALETKIEELRKEQASSLKGFAEAVKVSPAPPLRKLSSGKPNLHRSHVHLGLPSRRLLFVIAKLLITLAALLASR